MSTRTLKSVPGTLPLMVKAALPALPVVGSLPGIKHSTGSAPDLTLRLEGYASDSAHLDKYNEVCGFARDQAVPITYPNVAAFPLHLSLMTDTGFPFAPMGIVHLRNRLTQHRPIGREELFDLEVGASGLRPHPKGKLIDVTTAARIDGEVVWEGVMTIFSRGSGGAPETSAAPLADVEAPAGTEEWKLAGDLGRRYGAVSGDRNPIHLYPLTAKAFGFPRNIAHGLWTKARSLADLQSQLPDAYTVEVEFRKPIFLPSTVAFGQQTDGEVITFGVTGTKKTTTHVVGRVTPLS